MSEITVENLDVPSDPPDVAPEPEGVQPPPEPPVLERHPVAFQTSGGEVNFEAAPKRRGRPKAEPKPKGEPKKRGRPPKPREEEVEPAPQPPPIDINKLLEPLMQHYIATSHMRRESAKRQQYDGLFQNMLARGRF